MKCAGTISLWVSVISALPCAGLYREDVVLLEKHGNAGVSHIPADSFPRLGDDVDLAFSQRHSDATFELVQAAVGRQRGRRTSHVARRLCR